MTSAGVQQTIIQIGNSSHGSAFSINLAFKDTKNIVNNSSVINYAIPIDQKSVFENHAAAEPIPAVTISEKSCDVGINGSRNALPFNLINISINTENISITVNNHGGHPTAKTSLSESEKLSPTTGTTSSLLFKHNADLLDVLKSESNVNTFHSSLLTIQKSKNIKLCALNNLKNIVKNVGIIKPGQWDKKIRNPLLLSLMENMIPAADGPGYQLTDGIFIRWTFATIMKFRKTIPLKAMKKIAAIKEFEDVKVYEVLKDMWESTLALINSIKKFIFPDVARVEYMHTSMNSSTRKRIDIKNKENEKKLKKKRHDNDVDKDNEENNVDENDDEEENNDHKDVIENNDDDENDDDLVEKVFRINTFNDFSKLSQFPSNPNRRYTFMLTAEAANRAIEIAVCQQQQRMVMAIRNGKERHKGLKGGSIGIDKCVYNTTTNIPSPTTTATTITTATTTNGQLAHNPKEVKENEIMLTNEIERRVILKEEKKKADTAY